VKRASHFITPFKVVYRQRLKYFSPLFKKEKEKISHFLSILVLSERFVGNQRLELCKVDLSIAVNVGLGDHGLHQYLPIFKKEKENKVTFCLF